MEPDMNHAELLADMWLAFAITPWTRLGVACSEHYFFTRSDLRASLLVSDTLMFLRHRWEKCPHRCGGFQMMNPFRN
jgi:hypothetical protein